MSSSNWPAIKKLFNELILLPVQAQQARLREVEATKPDVAREVSRMLQSIESGDSLVTNAIQEVASDMTGTQARRFINQRIGNYRITEHLARGGMGDVYLAKRDDGAFDQQVAIKLLRASFTADEDVNRFAAERQMLARLDHPHIGKILDGGNTDEGIAYLAMEYVDGKPIDTYCSEAQLSLQERLRLFQKICSAVDYAHRNLIVHRDIKPSNILVNDQAEPKLLDFGIAKLLQTDTDAMKTQSGARLMSPLNASPEQVKGSRVTVTTDIYSLGVLLYQMLAGQQPYDIDDSSALAIEKAICETDPQKPSARLTQSKDLTDDQLNSIADARSTDPGKLKRILGGDLDNIVLKALDKHAERRYNSALEFSRDVQCFLKNLPVQARRPSVSYKVQKFVQRNRVPTAVAAIGLLGILTSIFVSVNRIAEERDIAQLEREKAVEISEFMQNIFESANPNLSAGENTTARELLNIGARDINTRFGTDSSTRITMLRVLGEAFYYIGNYDRAEELLSSALASEASVIRSNPSEIASTKLVLGMVKQYSDDWDEAQTLMTAAESERQQLFGRQSLEVVDAIAKRAFLVETQGDLDKAVDMYKEGLAIADQVTDQDHEYKAILMSRLSGLLRYQKKYDQAESLILDARSMQQRLYGDLNLELADSERQLAGLYRDTDQQDKAAPLYEKVIADVKNILGENHPEVGNVYNSYAIMLSKFGDHAGAITAAKEFLRITDLNTDGPSVDHTVIHNNIAAYYAKADDYEQSTFHYRKAIEMQNAVGMEPDHLNRAYPLFGLGNGYFRQELFEQAEPHHRKALELFEQNFDESHAYVSRLRCALAQTLIGMNELNEAQQLVDSALIHLIDNQGAEHALTIKAYELIDEIRSARE